MKVAMSRVSWKDVCWTECNVWWPWNIDWWPTACQPECHQLGSPGLVKQQPIVMVVAVEVESHHVSFMAMVTFWNSLMLFLMVRASEILHKGSDAPSMSSPGRWWMKTGWDQAIDWSQCFVFPLVLDAVASVTGKTSGLLQRTSDTKNGE